MRSYYEIWEDLLDDSKQNVLLCEGINRLVFNIHCPIDAYHYDRAKPPLLEYCKNTDSYCLKDDNHSLTLCSGTIIRHSETAMYIKVSPCTNTFESISVKNFHNAYGVLKQFIANGFKLDVIEEWKQTQQLIFK